MVTKKSQKVLLPFRYAGGKYYVLKSLRHFWETSHDEYREPFFGGGAVYWAKEKVRHNWINDIDKDLIDTLKFISNKNDRSKLLELFKTEKEATKEKHGSVKIMVPKNPLEEAYKFYYLNRTSYSGKMVNPTWGYRPRRSLPPFRWEERIVPCGEKLKGARITSLDFEKVIKSPAKGKKVLMYLDPPYYLENKKTHYKNGFSKNDHSRLCNLLKKTKFMFFLSYNDCPEIRKMYNWANITNLQFYYRQDNSRDSGNKRTMVNELVITNYK